MPEDSPCFHVHKPITNQSRQSSRSLLTGPIRNRQPYGPCGGARMEAVVGIRRGVADPAGLLGGRVRCRIRVGPDVDARPHRHDRRRAERLATAERCQDSARFRNRVLDRRSGRVVLDPIGAGDGNGRPCRALGSPFRLRALTPVRKWHTDNADHIRRDDVRARADRGRLLDTPTLRRRDTPTLRRRTEAALGRTPRR